jgi:hypothetical protein
MLLRFGGPIALLSALPLAWFASMSGLFAQYSLDGLTDQAYTSPSWDYAVRWRSAEWTVTEERSAGDTDILVLENVGGETVSYEGTDRFGDDPAACKRAALAELERAPGVSDVEVVPDDTGSLVWYEVGSRSYGLYVYRLQQNGGDGDWLMFVDCQSLVPGEATLLLKHVGPVDAYDFDHAQLHRVIPSRRSVFPWAELSESWTRGWRLANSYCFENGPVAEWIDDAALQSGDLPASGEKFFWMRLRFYNSVQAETDLVVDATEYVLVDTNGFRYRPDRFGWSAAPGPADAARQQIPPGGEASLNLVFEVPDDLDASALLAPEPDRPTVSREIWCRSVPNGEALRPEEVELPSVAFVFDRGSSELGMITWLDAADDAGGDALLLLRFTNTGADPWEIHPYDVLYENTFVTDPVIESPGSVSFEIDPELPVDDAITLAPGEETTIRYAFPTGWSTCTKISYVAAPGQLIGVGTGPCSGGAGARPVLRGGS